MARPGQIETPAVPSKMRSLSWPSIVTERAPWPSTNQSEPSSAMHAEGARAADSHRPVSAMPAPTLWVPSVSEKRKPPGAGKGPHRVSRSTTTDDRVPSKETMRCEGPGHSLKKTSPPAATTFLPAPGEREMTRMEEPSQSASPRSVPVVRRRKPSPAETARVIPAGSPSILEASCPFAIMTETSIARARFILFRFRVGLRP